MTGQPAPAVQTITCARCGGVIAIGGRQPRVRCCYCGHDQVIPPEKLAAIEDYERTAGAILRRIDGERGQRVAMERWYGADGKARGSWVASLLVLLPILVITITGVALMKAKVVSETTMGSFMSVGIIGVYVLGLGGYVAFMSMRGKRAPGARVQIGAQCPRCGGPQPFDAGRSVECCAHCGASLLAGPKLMAQAVDAALADLRREAMARFRLERNAMSNAYRSSAGTATPYIIFGSFLPITAGGAIVFSVDRLVGNDAQTPIGGLVALWTLALINGAIPFAIFMLRRKTRSQWRAIAQGAASRIGGRVTTRTTDWVGWLNSVWAGPYAVANLMTGPYFHVVTGQVAGFAVAVDLDPVPADSQHQRPRADVLLAAWLPGGAESVGVPPDIATRTQALGFTPTVCAGGFVALGGAHVKELKSCSAEAASTALVGATGLLAEWASRAGAVPATIL